MDPEGVVANTVNDGGYTMTVTVLVPWTGCANFCCLNDYNGDGDVGTDQDIQDFFS